MTTLEAPYTAGEILAADGPLPASFYEICPHFLESGKLNEDVAYRIDAADAASPRAPLYVLTVVDLEDRATRETSVIASRRFESFEGARRGRDDQRVAVGGTLTPPLIPEEIFHAAFGDWNNPVCPDVLKLGKLDPDTAYRIEAARAGTDGAPLYGVVVVRVLDRETREAELLEDESLAFDTLPEALDYVAALSH